MKVIVVKNGDNAIGFCEAVGANSASCVCKAIEVVSDTDGSVTITQKVTGADVTVPLATMTVTSHIGQSAALTAPIIAGDTITVSGAPTEGSAKYSVRLMCD